MYVIFVNDCRLVLTSIPPRKLDKHEILVPLKNINLPKVLRKLSKGKIKTAYVYHPNKERLMSLFGDKIRIKKAAGGVVENTKGEVLFIYRNNKWDLPKGKRDKGEAIEDTAMREVQEETGLHGLVLGKPLMETYHIFKRKGAYQLKKTHWYRMTTSESDQTNLTPQSEEGITEVCWQPKSSLKKLLENSYPNIKILLQKVYGYSY